MKYYIFLVLATLFWSGNFIFGRLVSNSIEPVELSFYRWFFVLIILLPYFFINYKRIIKAVKDSFLLLLFLSALGIAAFNTFLYYGLQTTTATNALLVNSSTPIIIIVLSTIILKTKISIVQILGVILSTLGVLFLILKGEINTFEALKLSIGDLWIILACISWALYSIFLKFKSPQIKAFDFLFITTFMGTIILALIFFYEGYSFSVDFVSNSEVLYSLIYMVIFPSILAFYYWNISTVELGANKAGQFTHLMPIFGAVLAYVFLDEKLETYHFYGIILIVSGIYLSMFYKKGKA